VRGERPCDEFCSGPPPCGLIPRPSKQRLQGAALNQSINRHYAALAEELQTALGGPESGPSWYAMAIYASRGAGKGMLASQKALSLLRSPAALPSAFPCVPPSEWERIAEQLQQRGPRGEAATFLAAYWLANQDEPERLCFDPRVLSISAGRLVDLLQRPGASLEKFAHTIHAMLEDGNRRIFEDIGKAGMAYAHMRRQNPALQPDDVLQAFSSQPQQARIPFADGVGWAHEEGPLPTDFSNVYAGMDSREHLAAGLALYQQACAEPDVRVRKRMVAHASNLLAYHEQVHVAVPAFLPGAVLPGEVDRADVMAILTPQIEVQTREWQWKLSDAALPDVDGSAWTPPATEHNWAQFEHRWQPILEYFARCQSEPLGLWPMPDPDPAAPVG
jgi:hypothetical protein